ncbi:MAG: hypothetical protein IPK19_29150 [Chloroflexi bacterium]|nr:hypothetical protein [Chloroflexota bacterium]
MITSEDVHAVIDEMAEPVLSVYLDIDNAEESNQAANAGWRIWLKNELKRLAQEVGDPQDPVWKRQADEAEDYFLHYQPDGKALALFIGPEAIREFHLSMPLESRIAYGKPLVTPLLWLIDEYEPYLIVLVGSEKTRYPQRRPGAAWVVKPV